MVTDLWTSGRKTKRSVSGWISGNAVCCSYRGHNQDKRGRGGILVTGDGTVSYSCFNCSFKTSYIPGNQLSFNFKKFLAWLGADQKLIDELAIESLRLKSSTSLDRSLRLATIKFETKRLPEYAVPLNADDKDHKIHVEYLESRGLAADSYDYYVIENESRPGIIIPYYYKGEIVGYTTRYHDGRIPKYISEQQRGYIFNIDAQQEDWTACILVEGQFDAISIDGCAYMGSTINDDQAQLLKKLYRTIIVVPDRDKAGMQVCDRALELGYKLSFPTWHDDVKDVNDAVKRYGKLPTLLSILDSTTTSKIKAEMIKRKYK